MPSTIRVLFPLIILVMMMFHWTATAHDAHQHESSSVLLDLEVHPEYVGPGETVTVRLWFASGGSAFGGISGLPMMNNAVPMTNRPEEKGFDRLSLTIFTATGDLLTSHQFWPARTEAREGGVPDTIEWHWTWDADKITHGQCRVIIQANGQDRTTEVAETTFWLGMPPTPDDNASSAEDDCQHELDPAAYVFNLNAR